MKKYNYIIILMSLLTIFFVGCDDNLDIKPEQAISKEVAISTPENIHKILINAYGVARSSSSYGGGIALASELLANDGDLYWNGTYIQPGEYNEKAILTDNSFVASIWLNGYGISNHVNIVLDNLAVITDVADKDVTEGEAKFLRGLVYFDLARLFAKPYVSGSVNSQLGVPIVLRGVLDPSQIEFPKRNTLEEVYTQVIADLKDAYTLLPASNDIFATKYSAAALLARVYLQKGDYANARNMADIVINESSATLTTTFAQAFNNLENSNEDLFAWQITSQDASSNDFNVFWAGSAFGGRVGNPDVEILSQHWDIYDDPNDKRADFFYKAKWWCTTKWKSQFANIPMLRLAEMYLTRAESNFRLGTVTGLSPVNDVNILRQRSGAALFITVDLATILMERKRELSFEGFALFDAKRLKQNIGSLPYDANNLILPIPRREIDVNKNLTQNDGY
ncbi:RagB/SusD family nutrient uptake outer membrane protein [Flavobacterium sp. GSP27]|uniref:RagB/SusD family nutrient uptake outer membrane protein n=1 Tax=unclassified Flavobacterium TaxID=196869 RepID=UPI000F831691|nr:MULTISPECIES: RagB/SusD family nutrient uptake outer membrane protein [unclassified Flavobacterium]RTY94799.1 RagB/SusD family nutrient uptake outer membrane protein [Flavobacterium sp. GSN2]RTY79218.1 RagB/SusD family nutrient uptake outer membrane protein [Flavobacterium sp. LS1P28]RTY81602.1 RagB/SusD family nutrient uptake outer membrane protein [Flavobacterium sp. ZB4P23]RTY87641.1 RagB/SusD family nutrient uptake outer membrane protein [Flavobacterium sp. RSP15]RTZ07532.1 RagB/SusD fa